MSMLDQHGFAARAAPQLGFRRRIGFGIGDFGINVFWNMTNLFAMFFYTDVVGISNTMAGLIIFGAMVWDTITDPLIGVVAERTRTRFGRFRPYLLVGALPLAVSFVLMFHAPSGPETYLALYALGTQLVFRTFYTVVSVPYSSLSARMTQDSDERGALAVHRMVFASIAGIVIAAFTRDGAALLGDGDLKLGFERISIAYAGIGMVAVLTCVFHTRENPKLDDHHETSDIKSILHMLSKNSAFWTAFSIILFGMIGATISSKAVLYYLKYNLGAEHLTGLTLLLVAVTILIAVPIWGWASTKIGKRWVWTSGISISAITTLSLWLNPLEIPQVVLPILAFGAIGSAANYFSTWSTLPDTVEYGQWKTGIRSESVIFGAVAFAQKLALGVATLIAGLLLDSFGYKANTEQTETALTGLKMMISLIPFIMALICLVIVQRYRLDQRMHARIKAEISARPQ